VTALARTLETHLAYVVTGAAQTDATSRAGLRGLTAVLAARTSVEAGPPQGVRPGIDELAFFPLIYWPLIDGFQLRPEAVPKVRDYLRRGGVILFDTRGDAGTTAFGELARALEIPPLVPVGADHVLTRAFYLLRAFPGRWSGGGLWVEKAGERINDGVSPVIAGHHDWAAAWAVDEVGKPLYPVAAKRREMAYRFGVNLVMYALTGNYKADQVHVPAILERLGQ
jgi:hypothetical protein